MEDKKILKNEELERVVGGWTHDETTIFLAFYNASGKIGMLQYNVEFSGQFSSGVSETKKILGQLMNICDQASHQTLDIDSAIHQLQDLLWSIPISEIKFACDDILEELTDAII